MAGERLGVLLGRTSGVSVVMVVVVMMMMMAGYVNSMNVVEVLKDREKVVEGAGRTAEAKGQGVEEQEGVAMRWGIADTTASVGRLFRYHIPGDAFTGPVHSYQVVEAGKDTLPSWLQFDDEQNVLQGLPSHADAGKLYLQVTARSHHGTTTATDVFSISVSPDTPSMSSSQPVKFKASGPQAVRCKREEPETVATLILDADLLAMPVKQRLALLSSFLAHMGLGDEMVKVVTASGQPLHDDSALVTGTGDAKGEAQHVGVLVSWLVGCGKVEEGHFPALHKLDDDSSSGAMGRTLGVPVLSWRVTNTRLQHQHALKRRRRQVRSTPTPVVTMAPPTDTMTRPVVDMSSPTFTIEPTPSQPVMEKTTTPDRPYTTPKTDDLKPSKETPMEPEVTKTDALPSSTTPKMKKTTTKSPVVPPSEDCVKPTLNKRFEKKTFLVGEVIDFQIPEDLFNACDMGGTSQTKLSLVRGDLQDPNKKTVIRKDWFMQFDQRTQTIRGMAMETDAGRHPLILVAMLKTHDFVTLFPFDVVVRKAKGRKSRVNHEMSMTIDTDYDEFVSSVDQKLDLTNKVAGVFGDEDSSALSITGIRPGSVIFSFTNTSLAGSGCPVDEVTGLADKLVTEDGNINPEAMEKLKPWVLTGAATAPAGDCEGNPDFPQRSASVDKPMTTSKPDDTDGSDTMDKTSKPKTTTAPPNATQVASAGKGSGDNMWITTVVPAVVIVAILLVALLVACILYRKKRKGKMNLEEQNTFVNKGAPVIFPDELDEKPSDSTKPLLIEGSPPAPPPEYHRGDSEGSDPDTKETTPPTDEVDAIAIDATSPLYQPPPPVPASSGKQARPHVQQPYRSQPPEIHP